MTALELLWLFTGNGPLFTRVATFITNKCTKNWWLNLLFINNYIIDGTDIVSDLVTLDAAFSHSHSHLPSSLVWRLLLLLECWSTALHLGPLRRVHLHSLSTCGIFILSHLHHRLLDLHCIQCHSTWGDRYLVPSESDSHQNQRILRPRSHGHSYLHSRWGDCLISGLHSNDLSLHSTAGYLIGICTGFAMSTGRIHLELKTIKEHIVFFTSALLCSSLVTIMTTLYNSLEVVPESLAFIVVIFNRTAQSISVNMMFIYFSNAFRTPEKSADDDAKQDTSEFNLLKAFYRLTFAVYVSNYLVIRTIFFTSRSTISPNLIDSGIRCISTLVIIYVVAFAFHVFLLAPLDNVRKYVLEGEKKMKQSWDRFLSSCWVLLLFISIYSFILESHACSSVQDTLAPDDALLCGFYSYLRFRFRYPPTLTHVQTLAQSIAKYFARDALPLFTCGCPETSRLHLSLSLFCDTCYSWNSVPSINLYLMFSRGVHRSVTHGLQWDRTVLLFSLSLSLINRWTVVSSLSLDSKGQMYSRALVNAKKRNT